MQKIGEWFRRLMFGRYGSDRFNLFLIVAAMLFSVLASFGVLRILSPISTLLILFACYRMFSRNIAARRREASAYNRAKKFFTDRECRYFDCPSCSQTVRVPRGKGRINIRCPRCGLHFEKRT